MTLGDKLIKYRKVSKMTQYEVADILKVTRQTISNWELNQTSPDLEQAKELSKLYKISLDKLIDNNIKEAITEKVSNVEKLSGLIYKILKVMLIIFTIGILLMIVGGVLFSAIRKENINTIENSTTLSCVLNNEKYVIELKGDVNNEIIELGGSSKLINILDLEKYKYSDQVIDVVTVYFENNNGSCN